MNNLTLDIASLRSAYAKRELTPLMLVDELLRRTADDPNLVWVERLSDAAIRGYAEALENRDSAELPLYGIPFAIKDNIDLAGVPTTAGCAEYAYTPKQHAFVVQRLIDAGAIPLGKTNLDQFATGLNGTRSPYGACRNACNADYISGGSSSGSAVAVALGYCSFSLGTDTAGSGRVPAAFNNIVGHKPSPGWLSASGLVPACRSLDTISVFALSAEDAEAVMSVVAAYDQTDSYSRPVTGHGFDFGSAARFRVGIPKSEQLNFFGNRDAERLYEASIWRIKSLGGEPVPFDLQPFLEAAKLLYEGPFVAERYAALREFIDAYPQAPLPVIQEIISGSKRWSAADAYEYAYRLKDYKRHCDGLLAEVDCVLMPTAGTLYTITQMQADPIRLNSNLGYYTNFMNLLDYAATAVPAGFQDDGLPFGVTLFAQHGQDGPLLRLAARLQRAGSVSAGATGQPMPEIWSAPHLPSGQVQVAVCGAHLSGLPLNGQLTSRGGRLLAAVRSAPEYRFYALPGGPPYRPGMVRVTEGGGSVEMEIWELPASEFGSFVAAIPAPLGIGWVKLEDGSAVQGFVCEAAAAVGAEDITALGSWRSWLAGMARD